MLLLLVYLLRATVILTSLPLPLPSHPPPTDLLFLRKVLPGILQKHCCILPARNTGKDQTDVPLTTKHISHTEGGSRSVGVMRGWCCWGNGCSVGGSYLSVYLFLCALCTLFLIRCLCAFLRNVFIRSVSPLLFGHKHMSVSLWFLQYSCYS